MHYGVRKTRLGAWWMQFNSRFAPHAFDFGQMTDSKSLRFLISTTEVLLLSGSGSPQWYCPCRGCLNMCRTHVNFFVFEGKPLPIPQRSRCQMSLHAHFTLPHITHHGLRIILRSSSLTRGVLKTLRYFLFGFGFLSLNCCFKTTHHSSSLCGCVTNWIHC